MEDINKAENDTNDFRSGMMTFYNEAEECCQVRTCFDIVFWFLF